MACDAFEVERLRARGAQRADQPALARAGEPANDDESESPGPARKLGDDMPSIRAIAAFELHGLPADLVQHQGQRAAALPAAPAVDQRTPLARALDECG